MSFCELKEVEKLCKNSGGIKDIELILPGTSDELPKHYCSSASIGDYNIADGLRWKPPIVKNSGDWKEKLVSNQKAGDYFDESIAFTVSRNRVNIADNIRVFKNKAINVVFTDRNGERYIVTGLRLQSSKYSGKKRSNINGVDFLLKGKSKKGAAFFFGVINNVNMPEVCCCENALSFPALNDSSITFGSNNVIIKF